MKEKSNVVGFGTKVKSFFKFFFCVVDSGTVAFCCAALAFQEFGSTKTNIIRNYSPQKIYKKSTLPTVYRNSNVIEF